RDADGKLTLKTELPSRAGPSESPVVTFAAEVIDAAEHRESGARELPISSEGAELELTAESTLVTPGAPNRIFVAATRPDGSPLQNAPVELIVGDKSNALETDAIGVAQLDVVPP